MFKSWLIYLWDFLVYFYLSFLIFSILFLLDSVIIFYSLFITFCGIFSTGSTKNVNDVVLVSIFYPITIFSWGEDYWLISTIAYFFKFYYYLFISFSLLFCNENSLAIGALFFIDFRLSYLIDKAYSLIFWLFPFTNLSSRSATKHIFLLNHWPR